MTSHRFTLAALALVTASVAGLQCGDSSGPGVTGASSGVTPTPTGTSRNDAGPSGGDAGLDASTSTDGAASDGGATDGGVTEVGLGNVVFKVDGVDREFRWNATATPTDGGFVIRADETADFTAPQILLRVTSTAAGTFACTVAGNSVRFRDEQVIGAEASSTVVGSACAINVTEVGTAIASPVKGTFTASVVGIATDGGASFTRTITAGVFNVRRAN